MQHLSRTAVRFALAAVATLAVPPATAQAPSDARSTGGIDTTGFDRRVRPQDDFFAFVNGGWLARSEIPADRARHGTFYAVNDVVQRQVQALITGVTSQSDIAAGSDVAKLADLYRGLIDTTKAEALALGPARGELARVAALRDRGGLPALLAHLHRLDVQTPLAFFVGTDARNSDRYAAYVTQSGLALPSRDYYLRNDAGFATARAAYRAYATHLLERAGGAGGQADPSGGAARVIELETALAQRHWTPARNRDPDATYNPRTPAELSAMIPAMSPATFLAALGLPEIRSVVVRQPDYVQALDTIIGTTPIGTWREYLTVKLLDRLAPFLDRDLRQARFEFRGRALAGLQAQPPREEDASRMAAGTFMDVLGRLYVDQYFPAGTRARADTLIANLREAFRQGIGGLDWMSAGTKGEAQRKLAALRTKIGSPVRWRSYAGLDVRAGDPAGNALRISEFEFQRRARRLDESVDHDEWFVPTYTVDAYATGQDIVFPAGILQPPFFDAAADDAVNYGAIGAVIGHEISHHFDDGGRKFDSRGNLRDWWSTADAAAFTARAARLSDQYASYVPIDTLHINGTLTLGENIGDLSGLAVAYRAYRLALGGREAPIIAGFTGDQRFFIGWAQVWRGIWRDAELRRSLMVDPHSPPAWRVNGVLVNIPEFYPAFGVKPGDRMYLGPEQRVKIW